jgi:hypothetical protein
VGDQTLSQSRICIVNDALILNFVYSVFSNISSFFPGHPNPSSNCCAASSCDSAFKWEAWGIPYFSLKR